MPIAAPPGLSRARLRKSFETRWAMAVTFSFPFRIGSRHNRVTHVADQCGNRAGCRDRQVKCEGAGDPFQGLPSRLPGDGSVGRVPIRKGQAEHRHGPVRQSETLDRARRRGASRQCGCDEVRANLPVDVYTDTVPQQVQRNDFRGIDEYLLLLVAQGPRDSRPDRAEHLVTCSYGYRHARKTWHSFDLRCVDEDRFLARRRAV